MPPKEATILADFLLVPAELRNILTLEQFTDIFPASQRESPAVKELYQELQRLRHEDVDIVRENIADEIKRSRPLRRQYARERRLQDHAAVAGLDLVALEMEEELAGRSHRRKPHTLQTIHPAIEQASRSIEAQIKEIKTDVENTLAEVEEAIGELSELRYGSFPKSASGGDIGEEVLATLKMLEAACNNPAG